MASFKRCVVKAFCNVFGHVIFPAQAAPEKIKKAVLSSSVLFHDRIIIPVVFRARCMPEINCTLADGGCYCYISRLSVSIQFLEMIFLFDEVNVVILYNSN